MSEKNEIQMDPIHNGGLKEVKGPSIKSLTESLTESKFNLDVKEFLKTYKYEILLGIIIVGSIIFKLWNEKNNIMKYFNKIELPLIIYINLEKDKDRNKLMIEMFEKLNYPKNKIMRFNAIEKKPGLEGCRLSHIEANKLGIKNIGNCPYYMICEDDIELINNFYEIIYQCLRLYKENVDMIKLEGMVTDDAINIEKKTLMYPTDNMNFMRGLYIPILYRGAGQTAGCYLSTINFGKKIIDILEQRPRQHADHSMGLLFNMNKVYISRPMLFRQSIHFSHIENRERKYYPTFNFELWEQYNEKYHRKFIKENFIYKNDKFYLNNKLY